MHLPGSLQKCYVLPALFANYVFDAFWINLDRLGPEIQELSKIFEISLGLFGICGFQRNVAFLMVIEIKSAANCGFHVSVAVDRFQERFVAHQGRGLWTWPQPDFVHTYFHIYKTQYYP